MAKQSAESKEALLSLYSRLGVVHVNRDRGIVVRGARLSPFYVDGMRISTSVEGLRLVTQTMLGRLDGIEFDVVAAPSISGIPYASVLAEKLEKRLIIDRGIPSKYGFHRRIEGELKKGDRVVVVDDIAKRGQTLLEVGEQVRALGAEVLKSIVAVDATGAREKARLDESKLGFEGLVTLEELGVDPDLQFDTTKQA